MKKDRRVDRHLKDLSDFSVAGLRAKTKRIEGYLKEAEAERDTFGITYHLGEQAVPGLWDGQRRIAKGDATGWNNVLECCWAEIAVYEKTRIRVSTGLHDVAPALLLRLACEGWSPALKKIRELMEKALKSVRGAEKNEYRLAYFARFVADWMANGKAKVAGPKGPLASLAAAIDGKLTDKLLNDACEFQLSNSGAGEDDPVEFGKFWLIPVWWFALERIRSELGLETPRPDNALFSTPFATLPPKLRFDPKKSELLKRILAAPKVTN